MYSQLAWVNCQPILEPAELAVSVKAAQVKRVVPWKVVATICRADALEASIECDAKCHRRQVLVLSVWEREVSNVAGNRRLQLAFRSDDFADYLVARQYCAEVCVAARVSADLDTGGRHFTQLS